MHNFIRTRDNESEADWVQKKDNGNVIDFRLSFIATKQNETCLYIAIFSIDTINIVSQFMCAMEQSVNRNLWGHQA